ncbi:hypothetical protein KQX54_011113 [Cotesia glomerata]|uniref:Uncharacterized protein n=1 Tax=Cotesia glomerata TaxID=32391 RepID=A0AAV7J6A4_COTGL|nr:hypothetical protein KQX54_011113 [Cotesia glomerata]
MKYLTGMWREANKLACDYCRGRVEGDVTELASTRSLYIRAEATGASRGTISGWGFGVGGSCDGDAATATAFGRLLGGGKNKISSVTHTVSSLASTTC